jgi:hypothetical protein
MGVAFDEPAPYSAPSLEALDIWSLMGREMRLEALPVIVAVYPDCDPELMLQLLRVINDAVQRSINEARRPV